MLPAAITSSATRITFVQIISSVGIKALNGNSGVQVLGSDHNQSAHVLVMLTLCWVTANTLLQTLAQHCFIFAWPFLKKSEAIEFYYISYTDDSTGLTKVIAKIYFPIIWNLYGSFHILKHNLNVIYFHHIDLCMCDAGCT